MRNLLKLAAIVLTLSWSAHIALADDSAASSGCSDSGDDSDSGGGAKKKPKIHTYVDANGVVHIKENMVICGQVPHPLALVLMAKTPINYEWQNDKPNFLKKVGESLTQSPF
jgi:hypothetical protein